MDVVGGVLLRSGQECKVLTGIDDHSRFVVCTPPTSPRRYAGNAAGPCLDPPRTPAQPLMTRPGDTYRRL